MKKTPPLNSGINPELKTQTYLKEGDPYEQEMAERFGTAYTEYRNIIKKVNKGFELDYPIHLQIENVYACNLKCGHCARNYTAQPDHKFMSESLFKKIIDEAVQIGSKSLDMTTWGEAFLDKNVFEKISYARDKGIIDIRIHSNGILINEEAAEKIIKSGVTWINISLDAASSEVYDKVRGGRYEKAVSAVGHILNAKFKYNTFIPKLRVSFVKQKLNEHETERFRQKFQGIAEVAIQQFRDRMGNIQGDYYSSEELTDIDPMSLELSCAQPFERVYIRYNGNVNPCCNDLENTLTYDNLERNSLFDIYNNQKAKKLKAEIKGKKFNQFCLTCLTR